MTWISYPIRGSARPVGDLPNLDEATLLAGGYISGFRATRVDDAVATAHLAETNTPAANGFRCRASTQGEIDAETARETAAISAAATGLTARQAEVDARAAVEKTHV